MRVTRERATLVALLIFLAAVSVWIVRSTEWADVEVPRPPDPKLANDRLYPIKRLLGALGVKWAAPDNLERLPPAGATLILMSADWRLFPERNAALKRFVMEGGHLVMPDGLLETSLLSPWVPIVGKYAPLKPTGTGKTAEPSPPARQRGPGAAGDSCRVLHEAQEGRAAFGTHRDYRVCTGGLRTLSTSLPLDWALDGPQGHEWLTVRIGRGRVSIIASAFQYPSTPPVLLRAETAAAFVAALDLRAGAEVWLVGHETRPPWYRATWQSGGAAVVVGALALALALWRGAVRFGPLMADPAPARRSVREQIAGTAGFVARDGGSALHRAALRALEETARARVPGYGHFLVASERAAAIAEPCALDPGAMARAMDTALVRSPHELGAALALLETARRGLRRLRSLPSKETT